MCCGLVLYYFGLVVSCLVMVVAEFALIGIGCGGVCGCGLLCRLSCFGWWFGMRYFDSVWVGLVCLWGFLRCGLFVVLVALLCIVYVAWIYVVGCFAGCAWDACCVWVMV